MKKLVNGQLADMPKAEADALKAEQEAWAAEIAATKYAEDRKHAYPSVQEQLDMIYWDRKNGTTKWEASIQAVKDRFPKPGGQE